MNLLVEILLLCFALLLAIGGGLLRRRLENLLAEAEQLVDYHNEIEECKETPSD